MREGLTTGQREWAQLPMPRIQMYTDRIHPFLLMLHVLSVHLYKVELYGHIAAEQN
jgi:hypothetical protein